MYEERQAPSGPKDPGIVLRQYSYSRVGAFAQAHVAPCFYMGNSQGDSLQALVCNDQLENHAVGVLT